MSRKRRLNVSGKKVIASIKETWPKEIQDKYDSVLEELDRKMQPHLDAIRECERITEKDLKIIINAKG